MKQTKTDNTTKSVLVILILFVSIILFFSIGLFTGRPEIMFFSTFSFIISFISVFIDLNILNSMVVTIFPFFTMVAASDLYVGSWSFVFHSPIAIFSMITLIKKWKNTHYAILFITPIFYTIWIYEIQLHYKSEYGRCFFYICSHFFTIGFLTIGGLLIAFLIHFYTKNLPKKNKRCYVNRPGQNRNYKRI